MIKRNFTCNLILWKICILDYLWKWKSSSNNRFASSLHQVPRSKKQISRFYYKSLNLIIDILKTKRFKIPSEESNSEKSIIIGWFVVLIICWSMVIIPFFFKMFLSVFLKFSIVKWGKSSFRLFSWWFQIFIKFSFWISLFPEIF